MSGAIPPSPPVVGGGSILVAVDGSEHALQAVRWACEQASLEHRPLVVVAVGGPGRRTAEEAAGLARELRPGLTVDPWWTEGEPREVLVDLSRTARLLVMGSRGRGTVKSMLLGSVGVAVTKQASCPVVVCRPLGVTGLPRSGIVVGADGTAESLPIIEFAFRQASLRGASLTVLHCFWDAVAAAARLRRSGPGALREADLDDLRLALAETSAGFAERYPDVPLTLTLKHGLIDEALSPRGREAELIVVGRHPATSMDKVLSSSISTAVLERAQTTVAVVPESPAQAQ